ncbi:bifunctional aminoglycoside phosphotransferase/ATP-binding protein [Azohydromonas aeria]|uniref:bifunctional aminoglycoside phosphotransferase/ATP-binding protein n=1 Tax=Azohydromonas aeria TaxID=2590212 RepID=UPI0012F8EAA5|nr:bifunctional aminoglycoside phosphotransferase/ATP-binding protein [Azohydromonas aeria]
MTEAACTSPPALSIGTLGSQLEHCTGKPVVLKETHVSWVLLTDRLAFKLKKPVRLPFLDFGDAAKREAACREELRVNRRLAPALYLGVIPVRGTPSAPRWGGSGPVLDHAVVMRRFADDALMSARARQGTLDGRHIELLAQRIAFFHQRAAMAAPHETFGNPAQVRRQALNVLDQLDAGTGNDARLAALRGWVDIQAQALAPVLAQRREVGAVRECHGDLHLGNLVVLGPDDATAFDAIEFDAALRWSDVMSDVAFATMDLQAHGRADLAFCFLDVYLQQCGDYAGTRVLRFFQVYRALVRALVHSLSPAGDAGAPDYLACAQDLVAAGAAPRLLITCGPAGSGKSTLAQALVMRAGAIRIRSDVERKRLFGLQPLQRSAEQGLALYSHEIGQRTYERMAACAREALLGGFPVIVDAAFLRRAQRRGFAELAGSLGVPFAILACSARTDTLRRRVAERDAAGHDASEAGVEVLQAQLDTAEPLDAGERAFALEVETDAALDTGALAARWLQATAAAACAP